MAERTQLMNILLLLKQWRTASTLVIVSKEERTVLMAAVRRERMKFQTLTSEYEIKCDKFGVMTLTKLKILDGHTSAVLTNGTFCARRGDACLVHRADNNVHLYFGNMHTSHIPDYEALEKWLDEQ